jgi:O-antigen/teichoic acid export membrane protein
MTQQMVGRPARAHIATLGTTIAITLAGVITGLLSSRILGPAGKGNLVAITAWSGTLLHAATLGISDATAFFAARRRADIAQVWITGQALAVVLGLAVTVVGWSALPWILRTQSSTVQHEAQFYFVCYVLPGILSLSATAWLQGTGDLKWFNISRASNYVVTATSMILASLSGHRTLHAFMIAILLGNAATWPVACIGRFRRGAPRVWPSPRLGLECLRYGWRVQIGSWSAAANLRLDQLALSILFPPAELGVYAVGVSYAALLGMLSGSLSLSSYAHLVGAHEEGHGVEALTQVHRRPFWGSVLLGGALMMIGPYVVPLIFGAGYEQSARLSIVLVPAAVLIGTNQILETGFRAFGKPGLASRAEAVGLVATACLLPPMLPRWGAWGAAVASLIAYGASTMYLVHCAGRDFGVRLRDLILPLDRTCVWRSNPVGASGDRLGLL